MNNFNLMMSNVEFPESVDWREYHSYVANVFWRQNIGKVSKVSVMPYSKNEKLLYLCLVTINEWFDSECAYNFIKKLTDPSREARLVYSDDNWWVVELNNEITYQDIYTVNFKQAECEFVENNDVNEVLHYVSDDDECDFDDILPPTLERSEGNYWCSLCGQKQGGMYSSCNNVNCEWFKKNILDIAFGDKKDMSSKKSVRYDDLPPTIIPPESWLEDDIDDENDDVPPSVMPPESWLQDDIEFEDDEKEEWVTISNENIPKVTNTSKYICGFCGESKRRQFSICSSCEIYGNGIDDPYDDSFNYPKHMKNVTLRKHQRAF
jgi:hypothetical protein